MMPINQGLTVTIDPELIERIYEAAALPERWPIVLEAIADAVGGFGATFVTQTAFGTNIVATPRIERIVSDYVAEGWADDPEYAAPLYADLYPGFRAETHYRTVEQIERLPVHVEFLAPRGLIAGVGTILQGTRDDRLQMAIEGLPSHPAAEAASAWLDGLRAPLGRALSLTSHLGERAAAGAVAALQLAGVAAAVVSPEGRLRSANDRFAWRLGNRIGERPGGRLQFTDRTLQAGFDEALARIGIGAMLRSLALPATQEQEAGALHLIPLNRSARDVFGWDGVLILLAEAANANVPGADLLRLLFDLTPTEARLTRLLLEGSTPAAAATTLGITEMTARTHLRHVFAKTGVRRQADLIRLLLGLGAPT